MGFSGVPESVSTRVTSFGYLSGDAVHDPAQHPVSRLAPADGDPESPGSITIAVALREGHNRRMTDRGDEADERLARGALQTLGLSDARLTLLGRGLSSNAWLVSDDATDRDLVLRVALSCAAGSTYEREHAVLARILDTLNQTEPSALRVPRPHQWVLDAQVPAGRGLLGD